MFRKILPSLEIQKGRVFFAYGNPCAIEANKRFTEVNLNRMFKNDDLLLKNDRGSYEYKRAQFLKKYLNEADALLDIHASFTQNSKPFIICEPNAKEIIRYLPCDLVVSGFDRIEPGGTDYYMNSIGKIGICIECGYLGNPESVQIAERGIFAFLAARGHTSTSPSDRQERQSYIQMNDLYMTKTNDFVLSRSFDDFESVLQGEIIGIDGEREVRAEGDGVILFARNREQVNDEAFLFGEKKNSLA
ncbi:MAG: succinylglutamate desuccinylase/aspartoacylase family protein [Parcubacteria group bacterium]|nr:succinylglutamate desuccinylase/aspartoacylase family protein [Parcubacteria group bacterium]